MKKKILSLAVVAGIAGGLATTAQAAMHINHNGLGEALVFPFFSAVQGEDSANTTNINIVNTTGDYKAVKVRFIEAMNSQEVLDFNLYLSPEDHWSGVIAVDAGTVSTGASIKTTDNSCTVPQLGGAAGQAQFNGYTTTADGVTTRVQPFVNYKFLDDSVNGVERTLEGYVEVIEMGTIDPASPLAAAILHDTAGMPGDCSALVEAWSVNNGTQGTWLADADADMLENTGGLYGYATVVNVNDGTAYGYDAVAVDDFQGDFVPGNSLHAEPGDEDPNLSSGQDTATLFDGALATDYAFAQPVDAVSALFMANSISNDFFVDANFNGATDFVVTMPTKRFYVQSVPALAPFNESWDSATSQACEQVGVSSWDREEAVTISSSGPQFSPRPPQVTEDAFVLCTEVSVISLRETAASAVSSAVGASDNILYGLPTGYVAGWSRMSFATPSGATNARQLATVDITPLIVTGLPVTGFAVQRYTNGTLGGGSVLSNYAAAIQHKAN